MKISTPYNKAAVAFVGFLAALMPILGINVLDSAEMQTALTSAITVGLVYLVPNATAGRKRASK